MFAGSVRAMPRSTSSDAARNQPPWVGAVVTAFSPEEGLPAAVEAIAAQVDLVVVVDDGSPAHDAEATDRVLEACARLGALVVRHDTNRGIGAALNTGLDAVLTRAPAPRSGRQAFLLTLDQDSTLPAGYVAALVAAAQHATATGVDVGMVGPASATGIRSSVRHREGEVVHGKEPIQSGLLLPLDAVRRLGPFDADLFIDGVDTDYYLRALTNGLAVLVAPEAVLEHRLGRRHEVRLGSRQLSLTVSAEYRYYYQHRNLVVLLRRHARREPAWALTAVGKAARHLAVTTVFVPGRARRWRLVVRGLADGFRGVGGRMPRS